MSKKILTTIVMLAFSSLFSYSAFAAPMTIAANDTNPQPLVTEGSNNTTIRDDDQRRTRTDTETDATVTNRAYPAIDSNCRYVDGRKICDNNQYETDSAIKNNDRNTQDERRNLNR